MPFFLAARTDETANEAQPQLPIDPNNRLASQANSAGIDPAFPLAYH